LEAAKSPLFCRNFPALKRVFLKSGALYQYFFRAWTPDPMEVPGSGPARTHSPSENGSRESLGNSGRAAFIKGVIPGVCPHGCKVYESSFGDCQDCSRGGAILVPGNADLF
jgi:hypothetical protein